jgi:hypothetical protein
MEGERGAAMVEFAIIAPLLILLTFGLIEFGLFFRDFLTVANTTRSGARVASAAGTNAAADYEILQSVKSAAAAMPGGAEALETITVFRSASGSHDVPAGCTTTPQAGVCNVYTADDLARPAGDFGCTAGSPDRYWCPSSRDDTQAGGTDYIGVYIRTTHEFVTRLFGRTQTITDEVVMRIEPRVL